jgi:hypothetical protein
MRGRSEGELDLRLAISPEGTVDQIFGPRPAAVAKVTAGIDVLLPLQIEAANVASRQESGLCP